MPKQAPHSTQEAELVEALVSELRRLYGHQGGPAGVVLEVDVGRSGVVAWTVHIRRKHAVEQQRKTNAQRA